jgi:hypothetical protein
MHDHRRAGDIGERLTRQPGRGHAGGNYDQNVSHPWRQISRIPEFAGICG